MKIAFRALEQGTRGCVGKGGGEEKRELKKKKKYLRERESER